MSEPSREAEAEPPSAGGGGVGRPRTLILAHRGAHAHSQVPDSTLAAFRRAAELPVDGVELDVRSTADGVLVVAHDAHLGGWPIEDMTLEQVRELQGSDLPADLAIPTFEDVLRVLPDRFTVNVELKARQAERALLRAVDAAHLRQRVVVTSFDAAPLLVLRRLAPEIRCGLVAGLRVADLLRQAKRALADVVSVQESLVNESVVRHLHQHGIAVYVWTVNEPAALERCFALGVDAVITDVPERALEIRERSGASTS
jgi:glycerophosphoryl diester phosphodiesterase